MRTMISMAALIAIAAAGFFYWTYGTLDPCRALAQEMADDTLGGIAERPMRLLTSQYSTNECVEDLWERWIDFDG
jgi:hypothetical protein